MQYYNHLVLHENGHGLKDKKVEQPAGFGHKPNSRQAVAPEFSCSACSAMDRL